MIQTGLLESGVKRIGAEQEMFLIDNNFRPAPLSLEILNQAQDPRLTTEIARFNLEANLTPLSLSGGCTLPDRDGGSLAWRKSNPD